MSQVVESRTHVKREANVAAHLYAREALSLESDSSSFDVIPVSLIGVVQSDMNLPINE